MRRSAPIVMKRIILFTAILLLPLLAQAEDTLRLAFVGDVMFGTSYPIPRLAKNDGKGLFTQAAPILKEADLAIGNLEGVLLDSGACSKDSGEYSYAFLMPQRYTGRLKDAGFDFMCMSNNHVKDFGWSGIRSTMHNLDSVGIRYAGVPKMCESALITRDSVRYGILAFGQNHFTMMHRDTALVKRCIKKIRSKCDVLIVVFHGGGEGAEYRHVPEGDEFYIEENRGNLRRFAHICIEQGADVVCGHGPHVVRGVELYKNRLIAYSLGNFCTPYGINIKGIEGYAPLLEVEIGRDGHFIEGQIHSMRQKYGIGPRIDPKNAAAKEMKTLSEEDFPKSEAVVDADGKIRIKYPAINISKPMMHPIRLKEMHPESPEEVEIKLQKKVPTLTPDNTEEIKRAGRTRKGKKE